MRTLSVPAFVRLVRLDTCILTASIVFVPLAIREMDLVGAFLKSVPLLLSCMCCFVLNDISDIEKDRVNHPGRPLPTGEVSKAVAMGLYFVLLAGSLLTTYAYVEPERYFLYLLCLIAFTNYNHVVEDFPLLKNFYVSFSSILPVLILRPTTWALTQVDIVALAFGLFLLGREILMDILDQAGDRDSIAKRLGSKLSTLLGFAFQFAGITILILLVDSYLHLIVLLMLYGSGVLIFISWLAERHQRTAVHVMKGQAALGLVFLF